MELGSSDKVLSSFKCLMNPSHTGCPREIVHHLCGCCGGAVYSIISFFSLLNTSSFNIEF